MLKQPFQKHKTHSHTALDYLVNAFPVPTHFRHQLDEEQEQ